MFIIEYLIVRIKCFLFGGHPNKNFNKAQQHAILALGYWNECADEMEGNHIGGGNHIYMVENRDVFVILGRGVVEEKNE